METRQKKEDKKRREKKEKDDLQESMAMMADMRASMTPSQRKAMSKWWKVMEEQDDMEPSNDPKGPREGQVKSEGSYAGTDAMSTPAKKAEDVHMFQTRQTTTNSPSLLSQTSSQGSEDGSWEEDMSLGDLKERAKGNGGDAASTARPEREFDQAETRVDTEAMMAATVGALTQSMSAAIAMNADKLAADQRSKEATITLVIKGLTAEERSKAKTGMGLFQKRVMRLRTIRRSAAPVCDSEEFDVAAEKLGVTEKDRWKLGLKTMEGIIKEMEETPVKSKKFESEDKLKDIDKALELVSLPLNRVKTTTIPLEIKALFEARKAVLEHNTTAQGTFNGEVVPMLTDIFNEKATGRPEKINEMADLTEEITGGEDAQFKLQNGVNKIVNTILSDHARVDEWQQLLGSDVSVPSPYIPIVKTKDKLILSLIYTAGKAKKASDAWQTSAEMLEDEGEKIKWAEKVLEDFRRAAERATAESNVKPQKVNQVKDKDTDNNDEQKALKLSEETEKLRVEREKFETMFNSAKTMLEQGAKSGFTGVQQGSSKSTTGSSKKQLLAQRAQDAGVCGTYVISRVVHGKTHEKACTFCREKGDGSWCWVGTDREYMKGVADHKGAKEFVDSMNAAATKDEVRLREGVVRERDRPNPTPPNYRNEADAGTRGEKGIKEKGEGDDRLSRSTSETRLWTPPKGAHAVSNEAEITRSTSGTRSWASETGVHTRSIDVDKRTNGEIKERGENAHQEMREGDDGSTTGKRLWAPSNRVYATIHEVDTRRDEEDKQNDGEKGLGEHEGATHFQLDSGSQQNIVQSSLLRNTEKANIVLQGFNGSVSDEIAKGDVRMSLRNINPEMPPHLEIEFEALAITGPGDDLDTNLISEASFLKNTDATIFTDGRTKAAILPSGEIILMHPTSSKLPYQTEPHGGEVGSSFLEAAQKIKRAGETILKKAPTAPLEPLQENNRWDRSVNTTKRTTRTKQMRDLMKTRRAAAAQRPIQRWALQKMLSEWREVTEREQATRRLQRWYRRRTREVSINQPNQKTETIPMENMDSEIQGKTSYKEVLMSEAGTSPTNHTPEVDHDTTPVRTPRGKKEATREDTYPLSKTLTTTKEQNLMGENNEIASTTSTPKEAEQDSEGEEWEEWPAEGEWQTPHRQKRLFQAEGGIIDSPQDTPTPDDNRYAELREIDNINGDVDDEETEQGERELKQVIAQKVEEQDMAKLDYLEDRLDRLSEGTELPTRTDLDQYESWWNDIKRDIPTVEGAGGFGKGERSQSSFRSRFNNLHTRWRSLRKDVKQRDKALRVSQDDLAQQRREAKRRLQKQEKEDARRIKEADRERARRTEVSKRMSQMMKDYNSTLAEDHAILSTLYANGDILRHYIEEGEQVVDIKCDVGDILEGIPLPYAMAITPVKLREYMVSQVPPMRMPRDFKDPNTCIVVDHAKFTSQIADAEMKVRQYHERFGHKSFKQIYKEWKEDPTGEARRFIGDILPGYCMQFTCDACGLTAPKRKRGNTPLLGEDSFLGKKREEMQVGEYMALDEAPFTQRDGDAEEEDTNTENKPKKKKSIVGYGGIKGGALMVEMKTGYAYMSFIKKEKFHHGDLHRFIKVVDHHIMAHNGPFSDAPRYIRADNAIATAKTRGSAGSDPHNLHGRLIWDNTKLDSTNPGCPWQNPAENAAREIRRREVILWEDLKVRIQRDNRQRNVKRTAPPQLRVFAKQHATDLYNTEIPSLTTNSTLQRGEVKSRWEQMTGKAFPMDMIQPFGVKCWAAKNTRKSKGDARSCEGIHLGMSLNKRGWLVWLWPTDDTKGRLVVSQNVVFEQVTPQGLKKIDMDWSTVDTHDMTATFIKDLSDSVDEDTHRKEGSPLIIKLGHDREDKVMHVDVDKEEMYCKAISQMRHDLSNVKTRLAARTREAWEKNIPEHRKDSLSVEMRSQQPDEWNQRTDFYMEELTKEDFNRKKRDLGYNDREVWKCHRIRNSKTRPQQKQNNWVERTGEIKKVKPQYLHIKEEPTRDELRDIIDKTRNAEESDTRIAERVGEATTIKHRWRNPTRRRRTQESTSESDTPQIARVCMVKTKDKMVWTNAGAYFDGEQHPTINNDYMVMFDKFGNEYARMTKKTFAEIEGDALHDPSSEKAEIHYEDHESQLGHLARIRKQQAIKWEKLATKLDQEERKCLQDAGRYDIINHIQEVQDEKTLRIPTDTYVPPRFRHKMVHDIFKHKYLDAEVQELVNLTKKGTFEFWTVEQYEDHLKKGGDKAINFRWAYDVKLSRRNPGEILRFKARLALRGDQQQDVFQPHEKYSPVASQPSVRIFNTNCLRAGMRIAQYDVPVAFLCADPSRGIVCNGIPGYDIKDNQGRSMYVNIKKNLYGSVEAAKRWADVCTQFFKDQGFTQLQHEQTIFINKDKGLAVCVYVDDFAIGYIDEKEKVKLEQAMKEEFDIRLEGHLENYLGMRYTRTKHGFFVDQEERIVRMVQKYNIAKNTTHKSPFINTKNYNMEDMTRDHKEIDDMENMYGFKLAEIVGELLYLSKATRPDIAVAVSIVASHITLTSREVFNAIKRILEYLWNTRKLGLHQLTPTGTPKFKIYVDASYMSERNCHGHSRYGFIAYLDNTAIEWKTGYLPKTHTSTTGAEYHSLNIASLKGMEWSTIHDEMVTAMGHEEQRCELSVGIDPTTTKGPKVIMYEDNKPAAMAAMSNKGTTFATRQLAASFWKLQELVKNGDVEISVIPTSEQLADFFTKKHHPSRFVELREFFVRDIHNPIPPTMAHKP